MVAKTKQVVARARSEGARAARSAPGRATLVSIGTAVVGQGFLLVSGTLAARLLGPADRGYAALLTLIPSVISFAGGAGLSVALTYYVAQRPGEARAIMRLVAKPALLQIGLLALVHAIVVAALARGFPPHVILPAALSLVSVPASFGLEYGLAIIQGQQRFISFNLLRTVPNACYSSALVVLLVLDRGTLLTLTAAALLSALVAAALSIPAAARGIRHSRTRSNLTWPELWRFARSSYIGQVAPVEAFRLDQLLVAALFSPAVLGIYVVGTALSNLPRFIGNSVGYVAAPYLSSLTNAAAQQRRLWAFLWATVALTGVLSTALIMLAGWLVPFLFGGDFRDAVGITRVLIVGGFFLSARRVLVAAARGAGLPRLGTHAEVVTTVSFLAVAGALTPSLDSQGIAVAFTSSAAAGLFVLAAILQRHFAALQTADG